ESGTRRVTSDIAYGGMPKPLALVHVMSTGWIVPASMRGTALLHWRLKAIHANRKIGVPAFLVRIDPSPQLSQKRGLFEPIRRFRFIYEEIAAGLSSRIGAFLLRYDQTSCGSRSLQFSGTASRSCSSEWR